MVKQYFFPAFTALLLFTTMVFAQKPVVIKLDNPSFEDYPQAAHTPQGWFDCGFAGESPVDVQPNAVFKVTKVAVHGNTYLGMVVRDVNTWEAIGQRIKTPILKGATYTFSLSAARSEIYESQSQATKKTVNYITPVVLRIWAGSGFCAKDELLDETEPISSGNWQKMSFKFTPKSTHTHFMIEAFYKTPTVFPYNGNVLIDNASDIVPEEKPVAAVKPQPKPPVKPQPKPPVKPQPKPDVSPTLTSVKPREKPAPIIEPTDDTVVAAKSEKFKEGQIMKIEKLQFSPNSSEIVKESLPQLDQIYNLLMTNPNLIVEIGGHTNLVIEESMAERLSTDRARAVAKYLVEKGIDVTRLVTRGYGRNKPIIKESSAAANKINQRVELKILSTNG